MEELTYSNCIKAAMNLLKPVYLDANKKKLLGHFLLAGAHGSDSVLLIHEYRIPVKQIEGGIYCLDNPVDAEKIQMHAPR